MPSALSEFTLALTAEAQAKETASAGSGVTWLKALRTEIVADMLDRDSALIVSTSLNGKADSFLHDIDRTGRLAAITAALRVIDPASPAPAGRRVTYPDFRRTQF